MSGHVLAYCQQVSDNLRKCFSYVVKFLVEAACYASFKYFDWKLEPCSSKANHPSSFRVSKALHKPLTHTGFVLLENKCLSPDAGSLQSVLASFCFSTPCFQTPSCALQWLPCPWGHRHQHLQFCTSFSSKLLSYSESKRKQVCHSTQMLGQLADSVQTLDLSSHHVGPRDGI